MNNTNNCKLWNGNRLWNGPSPNEEEEDPEDDERSDQPPTEVPQFFEHWSIEDQEEWLNANKHAVLYGIRRMILDNRQRRNLERSRDLAMLSGSYSIPTPSSLSGFTSAPTVIACRLEDSMSDPFMASLGDSFRGHIQGLVPRNQPLHHERDVTPLSGSIPIPVAAEQPSRKRHVSWISRMSEPGNKRPCRRETSMLCGSYPLPARAFFLGSSSLNPLAQLGSIPLTVQSSRNVALLSGSIPIPVLPVRRSSRKRRISNISGGSEEDRPNKKRRT